MTTRATLFGSVAGCFLALALIATPLAAQSNKADRLSKKQVSELIVKAKTPADHERLAKHYDYVAVEAEADAVEHDELFKVYGRLPEAGSNPKGHWIAQAGTHCSKLAADARDAAEQARALAKLHRTAAHAAPTQS
jgi:hypothetical protein